MAEGRDRTARRLLAVAALLVGVAVLCNPPFSPLHLLWRDGLPERAASVLTLGFLSAPVGAALLATAGGPWLWRAAPPIRRRAALALGAVLALTALAMLGAARGWHF